jgi:hypothetical protein
LLELFSFYLETKKKTVAYDQQAQRNIWAGFKGIPTAANTICPGPIAPSGKK